MGAHSRNVVLQGELLLPAHVSIPCTSDDRRLMECPRPSTPLLAPCQSSSGQKEGWRGSLIHGHRVWFMHVLKQRRCFARESDPGRSRRDKARASVSWA